MCIYPIQSLINLFLIPPFWSLNFISPVFSWPLLSPQRVGFFHFTRGEIISSKSCTWCGQVIVDYDNDFNFSNQRNRNFTIQKKWEFVFLKSHFRFVIGQSFQNQQPVTVICIFNKMTSQTCATRTAEFWCFCEFSFLKYDPLENSSQESREFFAKISAIN